MNKKELIDAIDLKVGKNITKKEVEEIITAFTATVEDTLKKGEKVQLVGFGTFEVSEREDREGRNPRTGETITIKGTKAPKFKAGKALKEAIAEK